MSKNFSKIFLAAALIYLVLPLLAMAAGLQLETILPKAPGMQEIVTGRTQLPGIIRYVVDWSIIIAALVTVAALLVAGFTYLTSRGRPEATRAAKDRIKNCLYGLLIIAGSFLVLQTINPQLTIMTIQRKTVTGGGVVMFTQAGLYGNGLPNGCSNSPTTCINPEAVVGFNATGGDPLEILIKAGAARYLNYDIANTITEFGKLIPESAPVTPGVTPVAFVNFPLYALGFFGDVTGEAEAKVFAYPEPQFNVSSEATANRVIEYRPGGKVDTDGSAFDLAKKGRPSEAAAANSPASELKMTFIDIHQDYAGNFKSVAPYYNSSSNTTENKSSQPHPPLSIRMQGGGPGVVLYADSGGMKNFSGTVEDFNLSNVKFDNQADKIELRNFVKNPDKTYTRTNTFLAILHSGYFFTGDIRYFFEQIHPNSSDEPFLRLPRIYTDGSFWDNKGGTEVDLIELEKNDPKRKNRYFGDGRPESNIGQYCGVDKCDCSAGGGGCPAGGGGLGDPASNFPDESFFYPSDSLSIGNAGYMGNKTLINYMDQFGRLRVQDKASSLELFELETGQGIYGLDTNIDGGAELALATKQKIACREVKLCTSKGYLGDCLVFVPNLPDFIMQKYSGDRYDSIVLPMPLYAPINIPTWLTGWVKTYDDKDVKVIKSKQIEFEDKIKSIDIKGDCAVILFENSVDDFDKCAGCTPPNCDKCWRDGGPGANSEVFTSSVADLTTHEISKCGGREDFGFGQRKNCASSIAIFPIKKSNAQPGQ